VPCHIAAFKVLIDPIILEVHVGTDVSLAALDKERVKVEFQDLLVDSECVLQELLITITDMADSPVERLAIETTVNLGHETLESLTRYEIGYNTIAFGLDSGNDFADCQDQGGAP